MSQLLDGFDPSATPSGGTFNTKLGATPGTLLLFNLSPFELALNFNGMQQALPAWLARRIDIVYPCPNATWSIKQALAQQNSPISLVWGEAYSVSEAAAITEVYPQVLSRVTNVGNAVSTIGGGASNTLEQDLLTPFVLSGLVASKDLSVANQLDVTAGVALSRQADQSLGRLSPAASTAGQFLTSVHLTTYFLDLNPDGTYSFGTSHSTQPNYLPIAQATTDGSGNISTVTDERTLNTTLLSAQAGIVAIASILAKRGGAGVLGTLVPGDVLDVDSNGNVYIKVPGSMAINLQSPNGTTQTGFGGATLGFFRLGGQATAGNYGVPVIIGSAIDHAVTSSTAVLICVATTPNDGKNHMVRFCAGVTVGAGATNNGICNFNFDYFDPNLGNEASIAPYWNGSSVVGLNAITVVKGGLGINTLPTEFLCAPNTTVQIAYQNTAAGTISDKISGSIELLT